MGLVAEQGSSDGKGKKAYKLDSHAVMFTYHGFEDIAQWRRFITFVESHTRGWKVQYWCASMETTKQEKPWAGPGCSQRSGRKRKR